MSFIRPVQPSEPLLRHQGGAAEAHGAAQHRGAGVDVALDLVEISGDSSKDWLRMVKKLGKSPITSNNHGQLMDN